MNTRSIVKGSLRYFRASFFTQVGIVAEKSIPWRFLGICSKIRSTSSSNPTANIWSASSSTKWRMSCRSKTRRSIRSCMRPGVPTAMSTPRSSCLCCIVMDTPPYTHTVASIGAVSMNSRSTCFASSRVGASTSALGARPGRLHHHSFQTLTDVNGNFANDKTTVLS